MGREVRRVPANWEHPKNPYGEYQPMFDDSFQGAAKKWLEECTLWASGEHQDQADGRCADYKYYWEWAGNPPDPEYYMPEFAPEERTHYMMYEDTSEGTPISPAFATPEELARWLADNGASSFGSSTASYEAWLNIAKGGWAPSMVIANGVIQSGVEFSISDNR